MKKKTGQSRANIFINGILIFLFAATFVLFFFSIRNGIGENNFGLTIASVAITFLILIVIVFLCRKWFKRFNHPILEIISDLDAFDNKVTNIPEKYETAIEYLNNEAAFQNPYLQNCLNEYLKEMENLEAETAEEYRCDITDFIYYDGICTAVRRNTAENIANSMTGIGILGTFIGLAIGLQSFSTDNMTESITPLINGIKTAFYTSIYGVLMSLILNHFIKENTHDLSVHLENFYDTFYEKVLAYPGYTLEKQQFDTQQEQKEILSDFTETIAAKLADALSNEIEKSMNPILNTISNNFAEIAESLNSSISKMTDNIVRNETEGLDRIVDGFVDSMNESLNGQFENLSKTIQETCDYQKKNTEYMNGFVDQLVNGAINIDEMNEKLGKTVGKFDYYLDKLIVQEKNLVLHLDVYEDGLKTLMGTLNEEKEIINTTVEANQRCMEQNKGLTDSVNENIKALEESGKLFKESMTGAMTELLNTANAEIAGLQKQMKEVSQELNASADKFAENYEALENSVGISITRTFKAFDQELAEATKYVNGALSEIDKSIEKIPAVVNDIFSQLQEQTETYIKQTRELEQQIAGATAGINNMGNEITTSLDNLTNINNTIEAAANELQTASRGLTEANRE